MVKIIRVYATILFIFVLAACSKDPLKFVESGKRYLAESKYKEAVIELRNAINKNPRLGDAHYNLGLAYLGLGSISAATEEFEKTVTLQPNNKAAQLIHGNLQILNGKFDEARTTAEHVLEQDPANIRGQILLASSYAGILGLNDSIDDLRKAFEVEPRLLPSYLDLSTAASLRRQPEVAEPLYKKAVSFDTTSVLPYLALGNFYFQSKRLDEAEQEFKSALMLQPNSRDANQCLAFFYLQTGKFDLSEQLYSQMAQSRPTEPAQAVILSQFYVAAGKLDRAIDVLQKLLSQNPKYAIARRDLADVYFEKKDYGKAIEVADQGLNDKNDPEVRFIKARVRLAQGKVTDAITELRDVVKFKPEPRFHYALGMAYEQAFDYQRAESELKTAIQNDRPYLAAYLSLAELKLRSADAGAAATYARQALSLDANLDNAHLILARAYVAKREYRTAASEVALFLGKHPGSAQGLYHQGIVAQAQGNLAEAQTQFEASMKADPGQFASLTSLLNLDIQQNHAERALQRMDQVSSLHKNDAGYYQMLAKLYWNQGNKAKAEEAMAKAGQVDATNVYRRIEIAEFYVNTGSADKGVQTLQSVLKEDPNNVLAQNSLAELYITTGEFDKALQIAEQLLKANPKEIEGMVLKGRVWLAEKKVSEAIGQFQLAITSEPQSSRAHYYLGIAYLQANDRPKAESELTEAIATAGPFVAPYLALAQLKIDSGDTDAAVRYAQQVEALNPDSPEAMLLIATATRNTDEFKAVSRRLQQAVTRSPSNATIRDQFGTALFGMGDLAGAEAQYEAALSLAPDSSRILGRLMRVYVAEKHPEKAILRLNQLIAKDPGQTALWELLAQVYVAQKDYAHAEESFKKGIDTNPKNVDLKLALARLYQTTGQSDKGTAAYEELLKSDPSNLPVKRSLAEMYFNQAVHDRAIKLADDLLKGSPKDAQVRILKGRSLLAMGKTAEALTEFRTAINNAPDSAVARYFLGQAYMQDKKFDLAETALNDAIRIDGRMSQAYAALANLKLQSGDARSAIHFTDEALKIDEKQPEALFVRGAAQMSNKDLKSAVATLEKLATIQPQNTRALDQLGLAYAAVGNLARAEDQLNTALRMNSSDPLPLGILTSLYLKDNKPEKALLRINEQIAKFPSQAVLYSLQGQVYSVEKNFSKAEESYRKTISLDRNNAEAYNLLGQLLAAQNATDQAILEFENLLKINPNSAATHTILGDLYQKKNASDKAQSHYREALKLDPQSPVASNNLAWMLAESGSNLDEALRLARAAGERRPSDPNVIDTVGWVYYKKGAFGSAAESFKECTDKAPDHALCQYHLGMSYFKLGDRQNARAALEAGLRLNPAAAEATQAKTLITQLH